MGGVRDFGKDPAPGSGVWRVTAVKGGRELGTVKAKDMDAAVKKVAKEIPAARTTDFVVTEIPITRGK